MKRTPLRRYGKRRQRKAEARSLLVALVLQRDGDCRFWTYYDETFFERSERVPPGAHYGPLDVHEIIPRSVWPDGDLDEGNTVLLCRAHHAWVTDHPAEAARLGLHQFSWNRP